MSLTRPLQPGRGGRLVCSEKVVNLQGPQLCSWQDHTEQTPPPYPLAWIYLLSVRHSILACDSGCVSAFLKHHWALELPGNVSCDLTLGQEISVNGEIHSKHLWALPGWCLQGFAERLIDPRPADFDPFRGVVLLNHGCGPGRLLFSGVLYVSPFFHLSLWL